MTPSTRKLETTCANLCPSSQAQLGGPIQWAKKGYSRYYMAKATEMNEEIRRRGSKALDEGAKTSQVLNGFRGFFFDKCAYGVNIVPEGQTHEWNKMNAFEVKRRNYILRFIFFS